MNDAGKKYATELAQREYSAMEYREKLIRIKNMECICHCSAEIDMGTLLFFSVNNMFLGQGTFVILLFSEISESTDDQKEGRDVFSRMYTYAIIEEAVNEAFSTHYAFYSSEMDGRLVVIISFPFGLLPDRSIVTYLDNACEQVSDRCRALYGMNVVTYLSEPVNDLHAITAVYTKLLDMASLHRYVQYQFASPAFHVSMPNPIPNARHVPSTQEMARRLVSTIISGGDYHREADDALARFTAISGTGIDNLKRLFGDYFELICRELTRLGLNVPVDTLRQEQFHLLVESVTWAEPVAWLHNMLDGVRREYLDNAQKASLRQFEAAVQYIDANLPDPSLTVDRCAAAAGCSVSALGRVFQRQLNISIARYIRQKRLEAALALLKEGRSVGEAQAACGFGSAETFHRAFKAEFGVTPGQMRGVPGKPSKS